MYIYMYIYICIYIYICVCVCVCVCKAKTPKGGGFSVLRAAAQSRRSLLDRFLWWRKQRITNKEITQKWLFPIRFVRIPRQIDVHFGH